MYGQVTDQCCTVNLGTSVPPSTSATTEGVAEMSAWEEEAEQSMCGGLLALAQLAQDLHAQDQFLTASQYYSKRLASLLREIGLQFDTGYID